MTVLAKVRTEDIDVDMTLNFDLNEFTNYIDDVAKQAILNDSMKYLVKALKLRIRTGKDIYGNNVKPLKKYTYKSKKSRAIFRNTGTLLKSITGIVYSDELIIQNNVFKGGFNYPFYINNGLTYKATMKQSFWMWFNLFEKKGMPPKEGYNVTIPKRQYFGFTKNDTNKIKDIIIKNVKKMENLGK
jgi:phage gpG-like protein